MCPKGCENCFNSICECKDFSTSPNYLECENGVKFQYEHCVAGCSNDDITCISQCNRFYNEDLKSCPCMEGYWFSHSESFFLGISRKIQKTLMKTWPGCADGCPCSGFECMPSQQTTTSSVTTTAKPSGPKSSVLILHQSKKRPWNVPVLTDINGRNDYNFYFKSRFRI